MRNGLFECDLERMECVPCYWEGGKQKLVRGTWYVLGACPPLTRLGLSVHHTPAYMLSSRPLQPYSSPGNTQELP